MNPPHIDRASLALSKKIDAKIRSDAACEMNQRMQSMTAKELIKLKRLLRNIEFLGDVWKAADTARVSKKLLDKWLDMPGVSWHINTAFNKAQALLHGGNTAECVLFWRKIAPELEKDAEFFRTTGQRNRESKVIAKLAARDLKGYRWHIVQAANNGDKHFFIDLGRILNNDLSSDLYDKLDADIADLFVSNPLMGTAKAIIELRKRGHSEIEEQTVRQRKKRLGLTKSITANCDKNH